MDGVPESVFSNPEKLKSIGLDLPEITEIANSLNPLIPEIPKGILLESELYQSIPKIDNKKLIEPTKSNMQISREEVINVENLSHVYLRGTILAHQSLNKVGLTVKRGRVQGLIGSNGSGKSTLLQHLNALIQPQSGKVTVLGEDLSQKASQCAFVAQQGGISFSTARGSDL